MTTITQSQKEGEVYYTAITRGFECISLGATKEKVLREHRLDLLLEMCKARLAIKRIETELCMKTNLIDGE